MGLSVIFALLVGNLEKQILCLFVFLIPVAVKVFILGTEVARLDFLILMLFLMWENSDFGGGGGGGGGGISGFKETSF